MQIAHDDSERKSNPRALLPRVLSRHRHVRLRHDAPHRLFRDAIAEASGLDFTVNLAGGACRPLLAVLESERDR
jgi:hypothetical protein